MMVAVGVASLLVLLAAPRIRSATNRSNIRSARGTVITMFQQAKIRAIQESRKTTLNFNNSTGTAWITAQPRRSSGAATCKCDTVGTTQNLVNLYGVTVNAAPLTFTFDPRGLGVLRTDNAMKVGLTRSDMKDSVMIGGFGEVSK